MSARSHEAKNEGPATRDPRGGPFEYPGRDSNSYNTRVLGDFESPASTDSATRARADNVAATRRALNNPVRLPQPRRNGVRTIATERLHPSPHVLLESRVPGALYRCHEGGKGALLLDLQIDPLALQFVHAIQRSRDDRLIRVSRGRAVGLGLGRQFSTQRRAQCPLFPG